MHWLTLIALIFMGVFILVAISEKFGKPMSQEQEANMSKWIVLAVFISLIAALIGYAING